MDLYKIFREGWQWANEQMIKFWWRSGSPSGSGIVFQIRHCWEIRKVVNGHSFTLSRPTAALVIRALAEVCTVPMLLVYYATYYTYACHTHISITLRHARQHAAPRGDVRRRNATQRILCERTIISYQRSYTPSVGWPWKHHKSEVEYQIESDVQVKYPSWKPAQQYAATAIMLPEAISAFTIHYGGYSKSC